VRGKERGTLEEKRKDGGGGRGKDKQLLDENTRLLGKFGI